MPRSVILSCLPGRLGAIRTPGIAATDFSGAANQIIQAFPDPSVEQSLASSVDQAALENLMAVISEYGFFSLSEEGIAGGTSTCLISVSARTLSGEQKEIGSLTMVQNAETGRYYISNATCTAVRKASVVSTAAKTGSDSLLLADGSVFVDQVMLDLPIPGMEPKPGRATCFPMVAGLPGWTAGMHAVSGAA